VESAVGRGDEDARSLPPFPWEDLDSIREWRPDRRNQWLTGRLSVPEEEAAQCRLLRDIFGNPFRPEQLRVQPDWLTWNDCWVDKTARWMYGRADFTDLPFLGDALEDAGCDNEELLRHCRSAQEHTRGCWAVDLLLGLW
jgi:hypothetical protein